MVTPCSLDPIIEPGWVAVVGTVTDDGGGTGVDVDVDVDVVVDVDVGLEGVVVAGADLGLEEVLIEEGACDLGKVHLSLVLAWQLTVGTSDQCPWERRGAITEQLNETRVGTENVYLTKRVLWT